MRTWNDPVLLTTYPHALVALASVLFVPWAVYTPIVASSSVASIVYHRCREPGPGSPVWAVDYGLAAVWGLADTLADPRTLFLNIPVAAIHWGEECLGVGHHHWHLLHVAKSLIVVYILANS